MVSERSGIDMNGFVYIIQSQSNGRYYIGSSNNIELRLQYHNNNWVTATKNRGPWVVRYAQEYTDITTARKMENKLKQLKSRVIIEKIITDQRITIGE